ncbi:hypothetical protein [Luteolibacter luteus]|uniref:Uncharacterized protein n=1 Tax=Luteolibacter luteus TaxID=2728835 RepID=A0A858RPI3_9BACT|nr:hypothetical protein [Luteolibacter luteus]QJE98927.1 hypothetical protein HHL09_25160 [Luteolibacter luteus]
MRRGKAILLFGLMTLALLGYAGWCARFFLMKPGVNFDPAVPQEARQAVLAWCDSPDAPGAELFAWNVYLERLQNPWKKGPSPVLVRMIQVGPTQGIYVRHKSRPAVGWEFANADGKWILLNEVGEFNIMQREKDYFLRREQEDREILLRAPQMPNQWSTDF